ncbi:DUF924 family protein [Thalassotalea fusca]
MHETMYEAVLRFWFQELEPEQWWKKDQCVDRAIEERFGDLHTQAVKGELFSWRHHIRGRLAEVIILDQFSRNIFRDQAQSFAYDGMAIVLAQEAIATGQCSELTPIERSFLYMPYMHSESLPIHEEAAKLFADNGIDANYQFELKHKVIIERFGRYPHRNAILGRESTEAELAFLQQPNSSF